MDTLRLREYESNNYFYLRLPSSCGSPRVPFRIYKTSKGKTSWPKLSPFLISISFNNAYTVCKSVTYSYFTYLRGMNMVMVAVQRFEHCQNDPHNCNPHGYNVFLNRIILMKQFISLSLHSSLTDSAFLLT